MTRKLCPHCGKVKDLGEFYRSRQTLDGVKGWCKMCFCTATRRYAKTATGRKVQQAAGHRYRRRFPRKAKARSVVSHALRDGKIARPAHCEGCGKRRKTQAHHEDYAKPLEIVWLCRPCHLTRHEALNNKLDKKGNK
jgi:hypothetical protein